MLLLPLGAITIAISIIRRSTTIAIDRENNREMKQSMLRAITLLYIVVSDNLDEADG